LISFIKIPVAGWHCSSLQPLLLAEFEPSGSRDLLSVWQV